jgi:hypothetical protein
MVVVLSAVVQFAAFFVVRVLREGITMRLIFVLVILTLFSYPVWGQEKQVHDSRGRLVEIWTQHGSTTDVRGPDGGLKETRTQRGDEIEVRDLKGRLLRIEKVGK